MTFFVASTLSLCSLASLLALLPYCESQNIVLSWFSPDAQASPGYDSNPLCTGAKKRLGIFKVSSCSKWRAPEPHFFDLLCFCIALLALIGENMVTIVQKCPFQCYFRWSHPTHHFSVSGTELSGLMFQVSLNVLSQILPNFLVTDLGILLSIVVVIQASKSEPIMRSFPLQAPHV